MCTGQHLLGHWVAFKYHLIYPHFCFTLNRTVDFPSLMFLKIMSTMPSQRSFSIQLFIESWNNSGKIPRIHPGFSDVAALAEGLLTNLQFKQYASRPPVVTEILGSFKYPPDVARNMSLKTYMKAIYINFFFLAFSSWWHAWMAW